MNKKDEKIPVGEIVVHHRLLTFASNLWYHHKWKILVSLFFLTVLIVCLVQCSSKESTDLSIGYAGDYVMTHEQEEVLRRTLNGQIPQDYDKNGVRAATLYTYSIFSEETLRQNATDAQGRLDSYTFQTAKKTNLEEIQNLRSFLQTGECSVWLVSEEVYLQTQTVNIRYFCRPLAELYSTPVAAAYDEYAVRLADTDFYKSYAAVQFLPEDTLIVLLRSLPMGLSRDPEIYRRSEETFRVLVDARAPQ